MAKSPRKKPVKRKEIEAVELKPDAWDQFEKTMDKIAPPKKPQMKPEKSEGKPATRKG